MGWYRNFSKKLFMAMASSGKYQTVCECEFYEEWSPGSYLADTLVTYTNPSTNKLSLYRAKGDVTENHKTDSIDDVPGLSIHWEFVCSCDKIGFTPTPVPTPTSKPTPTPSPTFIFPTPTPSIFNNCSDYDEWDVNKEVRPGFPHYNYMDRVQWNGSVYEVRDKEGTEVNDIPGISNHWTHLFLCSECVCVPDNFNKIKLEEYKTDFEHGYAEGFLPRLQFSYNPKEFRYSARGLELNLKLKNSNISGKVYFSKITIPFGGVNLYIEYNGLCYYTKAEIKNGNTEFELEVVSFPDICPTPTPATEIICGEGFVNKYETDGKTGSHVPNKLLSAEMFEAGGILYYNDVRISSISDVLVYASAVYKNEVSAKPFGVIVVTGKFDKNSDTIVYESPDGTCWKGKVQPFGQNIVMYRVY